MAPGRSGKTFDVEDPATGKVLLSIADAGPEDGSGRPGRRRCRAGLLGEGHRARERGEILRRAFELVTARAEDFALLMTLEMGKPLAEARGEVTYGAEFLRWFSEEAVRAFGRYSVSPDGKSRLLVTKKPVGPLPADHPVELPAGHGHPQDRPRRRCGLHHGAQVRQPDPADLAAVRGR